MRFITEALHHLGYKTRQAEDGVKALVTMNQDIDLVIADISMPGMNGFDLIREIRSDLSYRDVPIVVMTGLDSKDQRLTAIECGANDFISKPVDLTELEVRVASLLRIRDIQKELKAYKAHEAAEVSPHTAVLHKALDKVADASGHSEETRRETLESLALAAEYRDLDQSRHLHRMSEYSALLAHAAGLPPREVEIIKLASVMHDVGKLAVRNGILLKKGKLTEDERREMEVHAEVGASMLSGSNAAFMQVGEVIARTHHERWDGTGYPNGLAGTDISLYGRICAIADVFDALTSVRSYKEAYSLEKSWRIMVEGRGSLFDPDLLDLFIQERHAVEEIYARADFSS